VERPRPHSWRLSSSGTWIVCSGLSTMGCNSLSTKSESSLCQQRDPIFDLQRDPHTHTRTRNRFPTMCRYPTIYLHWSKCCNKCGHGEGRSIPLEESDDRSEVRRHSGSVVECPAAAADCCGRRHSLAAYAGGARCCLGRRRGGLVGSFGGLRAPAGGESQAEAGGGRGTVCE